MKSELIIHKGAPETVPFLLEPIEEMRMPCYAGGDLMKESAIKIAS
jgi:hypothetical protein